MTKGLHKFMKYSIAELESYASTTKDTCIQKVNTNLHVALGPYCLKNFKQVLLAHLARKKIGYYDVQLNGIILDIKNIKVLSNLAHIRAEDPLIHIDLNADCYIFCPKIGAKLTGLVKHIGSYNVGVILYRVFNANIRFKDRLNLTLEIDQEVNFCVRNFDLQNIFPYIDGDRLTLVNDNISKPHKIKIKKELSPEPNNFKRFKIEPKDENEDDESDDSDDSYESESKVQIKEEDDLVPKVKKEPLSEDDDDD